MVTSNRGMPDSENRNDELPTNHVITMGNPETDTEDEEMAYNGYEPLPLNDFNDTNNSDDDTESAEIVTDAEPVNDSLPPIIRAEDALVASVWSEPAPKEVDIEMDSNKVNEVKEVMMGITLPPSAIPEWASNIPEEEWKQQLMRRLESINSRSQ